MKSLSLKPGVFSVPGTVISAATKDRKKAVNPSPGLPLAFSASKSSLWSHIRIGKPSVVGLCQQKFPAIVLKEQTLRLLQRFAQTASSSELIFWLVGSAEPPGDGDAFDITIDSIKNSGSGEHSNLTTGVKAKELSPGELHIPCRVSTSGIKRTCNEEDYINSLQMVYDQCCSCRPVDVLHLLSIMGSCSYVIKKDNTTVQVEFDAVFPDTAFQMIPIEPLMVAHNALSKSLSCSGSGTGLKAGFLMMSPPTQQLILVLETDPKISKLPLIGIWVSGVESVNDPFVWTNLLRYSFGSSLKDRVCLPPEPFLLVVYSKFCTKPDFYDCFIEGGKLVLGYTHSFCHDVIELKKSFGPSESRIEMTFMPVVDDRHRMGIFYTALEKFKRRVQMKQSKLYDGVDSAEEIVPRTFPVPFNAQGTTVLPSVPEVTVLMDGELDCLVSSELNLMKNISDRNPVKMPEKSNIAAQSAETMLHQGHLQGYQLQKQPMMTLPTKSGQSVPTEDRNTWQQSFAPVSSLASTNFRCSTPAFNVSSKPHTASLPYSVSQNLCQPLHCSESRGFAMEVPYTNPMPAQAPYIGTMPAQGPCLVSVMPQVPYMNSLMAPYCFQPQQPFAGDPRLAFAMGQQLTGSQNLVRLSQPQYMLRNRLPLATGNQARISNQHPYCSSNSNQVRFSSDCLPVKSSSAQGPSAYMPLSSAQSSAVTQSSSAVCSKRKQTTDCQNRPKSSCAVGEVPVSDIVHQSPVNWNDNHFVASKSEAGHNSCSTDSGLHVNDSSSILDSPPQRIAATHQPGQLMSVSSQPLPASEVDIYRLYKQKKAEYKNLERLVKELEAAKGKELKSVEENKGRNVKSISDHPLSEMPLASQFKGPKTCSVAVNTSRCWPGEQINKEANREQFLDSEDNIQDRCCSSKIKQQSVKDRQPSGTSQPKQSQEELVVNVQKSLQQSVPVVSNDNRKDIVFDETDLNIAADIGDMHLSSVHEENSLSESSHQFMDMDIPCFESMSNFTERLDAYRDVDTRDGLPTSKPSTSLKPDATNHQSDTLKTKIPAKKVLDSLNSSSRFNIPEETWYVETMNETWPLDTDLYNQDLDCEALTCEQTFSMHSVDQSFFDQTFLPRIELVDRMPTCGGNSSEISMAADVLMMKYLNDDELAKLRMSKGHGHVRQHLKVMNDSSFWDVDVHSNQMSFASQKYLEKYGLLQGAAKPKDNRARKKPGPSEALGKNDCQEEQIVNSRMNVGEFFQKMEQKQNVRSSLEGGGLDRKSASTDSGSAKRHSLSHSSSNGSWSDGDSCCGHSSILKPVDECQLVLKQVGPMPISTPPSAAVSQGSKLCPLSGKIRQNQKITDRTMDMPGEVLMDSNLEERLQVCCSPAQQKSDNKIATSDRKSGSGIDFEIVTYPKLF